MGPKVHETGHQVTRYFDTICRDVVTAAKRDRASSGERNGHEHRLTPAVGLSYGLSVALIMMQSAGV
ncbi:MAG: hypothetical protein U9R51_02040 [Actinomycetota bacterium]|nr:hypothetical protein [Actinomycetota bacterium]